MYVRIIEESRWVVEDEGEHGLWVEVLQTRDVVLEYGVPRAHWGPHLPGA